MVTITLVSVFILILHRNMNNFNTPEYLTKSTGSFLIPLEGLPASKPQIGLMVLKTKQKPLWLNSKHGSEHDRLE